MDLSACIEAQKEELEALAAIYGDDVFSYTFEHQEGSDGAAGRFLVTVSMAVELSPDGTTGIPVNISLEPSSSNKLSDRSDRSGPQSLGLKLAHLPPVQLSISLPSLYPQDQNSIPIILEINTSPSYLTKNQVTVVIPELMKDVFGRSDGGACLYEFLEIIRTGGGSIGSSSSGKGLGGSMEETGAAVWCSASDGHGEGVLDLARKLQEWESTVLGKDFDGTTFPCGICLEGKKGRVCVEIEGCKHVFCRLCLERCWKLAITEGDIMSVACPSFQCIKLRTSSSFTSSYVSPSSAFLALVEQIVGADLLARFNRLADKKRIDSDPTYTVCPLPSCQAPVPAPEITKKPGEAKNEDRWEKYRQCPKCGFPFCLFCKLTWHGPHTPCPLPTLPAFIQTYLSLDPTDPGRRLLEARYGKKNMERMAAQAVEDEENRKWLEGKTMECPGCGVRTEKSHGCNHMSCVRCQAHFCFRCGKSLSVLHPYKHYNNPESPCFEKLFDQNEIDAFNREAAGGWVDDGGLAGFGHLF
ncbi:Predicted E3 ubiquitin ligase [Phaffia rhodozyma]|uniref:RBR-type E3 ubiquitin transferase n=1 Tax=Phaffia rhodozyma TaxID=264483 RepID=A0A0F7SIM9_PHARH|nr:Predicted E3 ubiquitin ligase [Phaffia rhodozyma]